MEFRPN